MKLWSVLLQASDSSLATQVVGVCDTLVGAKRHARRLCEGVGNVLSGITVGERGDREEIWFDVFQNGEMLRPAYVTVAQHFLNEVGDALDMALMLDAVRGSDKP